MILNLTGGNSKQNYYAGFGYLNDESYAKGSGFDRYTGRIRGEKELASWLKGGVNLSYAHTVQKYPTTSGGSYVNYFQWTRHIAPVYPVYLRDPATATNWAMPARMPHGATLPAFRHYLQRL